MPRPWERQAHLLDPDSPARRSRWARLRTAFRKRWVRVTAVVAAATAVFALINTGFDAVQKVVDGIRGAGPGLKADPEPGGMRA